MKMPDPDTKHCVVRLQPGDRLIVATDRRLSIQQADIIRRHLEAALAEDAKQVTVMDCVTAVVVVPKDYSQANLHRGDA